MSKFMRLRGLTTDVVIFTIENGDLKVLLVNRADVPFKGKWALPGGFIFDGESSHDAAVRILKNKAGIKNVYLEQLYTFDKPGRDPRGKICSIAYLALAPHLMLKLDKGIKLQTPSLVSVKKLPDIAFDHKTIIKYASSRLQAKLEYTNTVYSLLPKEFTFNELQMAYEAIFGKQLDKRNFRKKFLQLGLIKPINKKYSGTRQRPAQLFKFISQKPVALKKFF